MLVVLRRIHTTLDGLQDRFYLADMNQSPARQTVTLNQLVEQRPFLTLRWARSLVASGELPHYKLGGRLLFDLDEVDAKINASRSEATTGA